MLSRASHATLPLVSIVWSVPALQLMVAIKIMRHNDMMQKAPAPPSPADRGCSGWRGRGKLHHESLPTKNAPWKSARSARGESN